MTAKPVPEHISDERLAYLIKGCDGVTPGPWTYGAQWLCRRKPGPEDDYEYLAQVPLNDYDSPRWNKDAAHLSRLDPQTVLSLLTELQHRREAEAGTRVGSIVDDQYVGPFTKCSCGGTKLELRGKFWCCTKCGASYGEHAGPAASPSSPASGVRVKVIDWQQSPPFITSISGDGSYEVNVKVHSMAELHAAHDLVLKAFSDAHSDLLAKRWADANQG